MRFLALSSLTLALAMTPALAAAQGTTPRPPPPGGGDQVEPSSGDGTAGGEDKAEKAAPKTPAAGYAYSDKPQARAARPRIARRASGPSVNIPGFEQLPDGGSRLFVQLSQSVPVEERRAQGSITYVLKGAHVRVRNNTNALVTVHFNTPVYRARLVPHGHDLHFVVELRAAAAPTFKMTEAQDKSAMLTIDFGKGDFAAIAPPATVKATKRTKGRGTAKGAPAPAPEPAPPAGPTP